jgi:4-hydroxybenzoate polyprenyltransferase
LTAAFSLFAGGGVRLAFVLAGAMFALQISIGAANDLFDEAYDRSAKPSKPLPAGLVGRRSAAVVAVAGGVLGLVLAALQGTAVLVIALAGYGLGLLYDAGLKRSPWAWLPLALALPLVPAFAWVAASGTLPPRFPLLMGMGLLAGVALAVANGLVDLPEDAASGSRGIAVTLGRARSLRLVVACEAALVVIVVLALTVAPPGLPAVPSSVAWAVTIAGAACCLAGIVLSAQRHGPRREAGWEIQALGTGLLALGWFAGQPA